MTSTPSLPAELTIFSVADTRERALRWLDAHPDEPALHLAAADVAEVDGAGVQLLVALARSLEQRGRALTLDHPSEPLRRACAGLGAGFLVAEPVEIGS